MARWPDVPEVHGWLRLDARGRFRLRVPESDPPRFETIANPALLGFIARNYAADESGRWYFQNGPQRVFVELDVTPWALRLGPYGRVTTQTGRDVAIEAVLRTDDGMTVLVTDAGPGLLDDRDLPAFVEALVDAAGRPPDDARLEAWLTDPDAHPLLFRSAGREFPVETVAKADLPSRFGYVRRPDAI